MTSTTPSCKDCPTNNGCPTDTTAVVALSFTVLVLATTVGIIFVLFWRGALVIITHDGERRFKRSATALSIASNSSKTDQDQLNDKNVIRGEYVNFEIPKTNANQTQFHDPDVNIGQRKGRHKSKNSQFNPTSENDIDGIRSTRACQDTAPRLLSQQDCGAKTKGLSYSFVDVTINKDGAEFTYDKAKSVPHKNDKSLNPPAFEDNVYDRTKGRNETYDVTYQPDHVAIRSNNYDHANTLGAAGTAWNMKKNIKK